MPFALRDYQKQLGACLRQESSQHRPGERLLIQIATGGGKTCVLNEAIRHIVARGDRALVVTKDWTLLAQAAEDFTGRCGGAGLVGYLGLGPEPRRLFAEAPRTVRQPVVYTTIHSWFRRADKDFADQRFEFVFIDELHWGEAGTLYRKLLDHYAETSMFIGFTATPRNWTSFRLVDRAYDFAELLNRRVLSRPIVVEPRATNILWSPELSSEHGDISQSSLNELAESETRNNLIVKTYCDEPTKWGKTLVFACNIDHAEVLTGMFQDRRIRCGVIHHKLTTDEKQQVRDGFRGNDLDVLVNVTMFTHGVDIPEIRSIFLGRPTTSDILFSQMIGRGSRRTAEKDSFYVVDFVDTVQKHGIPIIRPDGFFGSVALTKKSRNEPLKKHTFRKCPLTTFPSLPGYESLEGLDIQPEQTFGIEFEIAPKSGETHVSSFDQNWLNDCIATALEGVAPYSKEVQYDHTAWRLKRDTSCGLELTTRILRGPEGFMEVHDVLKILHLLLDTRGYRVSMKTGTHVHLGCSGVHFSNLRRFYGIVAFYEPALYSLVAPSRIDNKYTQSVRLLFKKIRLQSKLVWKEMITHYTGVSLTPKYGTFEVRMHNGTLEADKILPWVSLWMRIFAKSLQPSAYVGDPSRRIYRQPLTPGPRGDILHLCDFVGASETLKRRLDQRRFTLVQKSWLKHEKYGKLARQVFKKWYPGVLPPEMAVLARPSDKSPRREMVGYR